MKGELFPIQAGVAFLHDSARPRHTYIIGKPEYGKSTLIHNLAIQDILLGRGVCVIDPKGDLATDLLNTIPPERAQDTYYIDRHCLLPISVMKADTEDQRNTLANDMVHLFQHLNAGDHWGPKMGTLLKFAVHTLVRMEEVKPDAKSPKRPTTFLDLYSLITDDQFRRYNLPKNLPRDIATFWEKDFESYTDSDKMPVITRMTDIRLSPSLKALLGTSEDAIDFSWLMNESKILIVNLGSFEPTDKRILGSMLVFKFQSAMWKRQPIPEKERVPFYFYVDEFQNFVSTPFSELFPMARGFKLCLTVAHQGLWQLGVETRGAVTLADTMFFFNIDAKDAAYFKLYIEPYEPRDLTVLPKYACVYRGMNQVAYVSRTLPPPVLAPGIPSSLDDITRRSRALAERSLLAHQKTGESQPKQGTHSDGSFTDRSAHKNQKRNPQPPR